MLFRFGLVAGVFLGAAGGFGVTGGVHRLWTHRSYKAKWPLRVILALCYSVSGQVRHISCSNLLLSHMRNTNMET
jgi:fatty-acid desaturase